MSGAPPKAPSMQTVRGAPASQAPPSLPEVARLLRQACHTGLFSAVACLGARNGRVLHVSAHGSPRTPPPARPVLPGAMFDLGQLTGSLSTALAVAFLVGRGRLDLSMPLQRALPEAQGTAFGDVPLDMLLDHTSGLGPIDNLLLPVIEADRRRIGEARVMGSPKAAPEVMQALGARLTRAAGPAGAAYNSLNTYLLGLAVAAVVQKPLDAWLHKELWPALSLTDAVRYVTYPLPLGHAKLPFVATGHCPVRNRLVQGEVHDPLAYAVGGAAGHAGLFGHTLGVFRVVEALRLGACGQHRMLHAGTLTRLFTRLRRTGEAPYTLGWQSMTKHGPLGQGRWHPTSVGQVDAAGGCAYLIDPASQDICILLSNPEQGRAPIDPDAWRKLCRRVFDSFVTVK